MYIDVYRSIDIQQVSPTKPFCCKSWWEPLPNTRNLLWPRPQSAGTRLRFHGRFRKPKLQQTIISARTFLILVDPCWFFRSAGIWTLTPPNMQVLPSKATFHVPRNAAVPNTMRPTRGVAPFRMHRNCGADLVPGNAVSHRPSSCPWKCLEAEDFFIDVTIRYDVTWIYMTS